MLLILVSLAVAASAQGPFGRGGGSSAMLLGIPEVQKELNLNDDQTKQITTLLTDAREKMRASFGQVNFQELQTLSADEREKRIGEMRKKFEESAKGIDEKLGTILEAKQAQRLKELQYQRDGANALTRDDVAKKIGLSPDQAAKIKKILEGARPAMGAFGPNQSNEDRQAMFQKMRAQFEKAQKECFAVLNDDQMLDWTNLCGKTFKFPERQGFRGGNRPAPAPQQ
jgi:hypothetical protein